MVDSAIFWTFAVVAVTAALSAILSRSVIYAALSLIAVFLSIAAFFILNNADFLAVGQIVVYAVGLTIIMLFAIMFTGDRPMPASADSSKSRVIYGIVLLYTIGLLIPAALYWVRIPSQGGMSPAMIEMLVQQGSTLKLGADLFHNFILPFELTAFLLLGSVIGAIVIAKKRFISDDEERLSGVRMPVETASAPAEDAIAALRKKRLGLSGETEPASSEESLGAK